MIYFYLFFFLLFCLFLLSIIYFASIVCFFIFGAPYVKTSFENAEKMFDLAKIKPGERFYDLGCGDGRLLFMAESKFKARAYGFEIAPLPYFLAQIKKFFKRSKVKIYFKNFMKEDLSKADVVFCFLMPKPMQKLRIKFEKELKKDTRIVSNAFAILGWKPKKIIYNKKTPLFLYHR